MELKSSISLFSRTSEHGASGSSEEDVWDDTALIEAYDRAVSLAKEEVQRRMNKTSEAGGVSSTVAIRNKKEKKKFDRRNAKSQQKSIISSNGSQWKANMPCQAAYHEDGKLYEAIIETISVEDGVCLIRFLGYDNKQLTCIEDLLPSEGPLAQNKQIQEAQELSEGDGMDWINSQVGDGKEESNASTATKHDKNIAGSTHAPTHSLPFPPPPPPTQFSGPLPSEESEALSSMLMSWYLNGFHTGYYMGLKKGKETVSKPDMN